MYSHNKNNNELIYKIGKILDDFKDFEQPIVNNNGDIIIKNKTTITKTYNASNLANIFKEIIKNDVKKNRV